jgi:hypothetical protein
MWPSQFTAAIRDFFPITTIYHLYEILSSRDTHGSDALISVQFSIGRNPAP